MKRQSLFLAGVILALVCGIVISSLPASASHSRDVSPQNIDPNSLVLPSGALPAGAVVDHQGVSDNADADSKTTPPDGFKAQTRIVHSKDYGDLGRRTGYRLDIHYSLQGAAAGTEYLASVFSDAGKARAAVDDATNAQNFSILTVIAKPLPDAEQCHAGTYCIAYYGPNPGSPNEVVFAFFVRGPVLVEAAAQVPSEKFDSLRPALEATLYAMLSAADERIQRTLNPTPDTATPTNTSQPVAATATTTAMPTATATATPIPKAPQKKCKKNETKTKGKCVCKKGYVKKKGKCVKKH